MNPAGEADSGAFVDEADVDTIEMELRPEDVARLAQISVPEVVTSAPAEGDQPASVRVQSIQVELAAGLAPKPAETPVPPALHTSPGSDEPAAPAKNAPVSVIDEAQFSKPTVSTARILPISAGRESPASRTRRQFVTVAPASRVQVSSIPAARVTADESPTAATSDDARRGTRWLGVALIGLFAIGAVSVWLSSVASFQAEAPAPRVPIATVEPESAPTPVAPPAASPPIPQTEALKFRNPFDAAEVFEFPAGTSRTDARQAIAQFLLQRACERQGQRATANAAGSPCGRASRPADLLRTTTKVDGT
jgi:hypothetical protein